MAAAIIQIRDDEGLGQDGGSGRGETKRNQKNTRFLAQIAIF